MAGPNGIAGSPRASMTQSRVGLTQLIDLHPSLQDILTELGILAGDVGGASNANKISSLSNVNSSIKTSDYTVTMGDLFVVFDTTAGILQANLPKASDGKQLVFIKKVTTDPNNVTINPFAGDTCDVSALYYGSDGCFIYSDGVSNWTSLTVSDAAAIHGVGFAITSTLGGVFLVSQGGYFQTVFAGGDVIMDNTGAFTVKQADDGGLIFSKTKTMTSGSISGNIVWTMPERGSAFKKVILEFNAMNDAGTVVTFPVAFDQTPVQVANSTGLTISTLTASAITIPVSAGVSGWIILEGF